MATSKNNPLIRMLKGATLFLLVALVAEVVWFSLLVSISDGYGIGSQNYNVQPPAIVPMASRESFDESVERSLFSWNRRPKATEQQSVSEEGLPSKWLLTGVVNTGTATYAIFSDVDGKQRLRLEAGMYLEKWKLESITAEQVTLSDGDETEVFYLRETGQEQKTLPRSSRKDEGEESD